MGGSDLLDSLGVGLLLLANDVLVLRTVLGGELGIGLAAHDVSLMVHHFVPVNFHYLLLNILLLKLRAVVAVGQVDIL